MTKPKILLVEDNRLLGWWMESSLEHAGFLVSAASSAAEALLVCDSCAIDVLITNCNLGEGCDGFEVLAHARRKAPELFAVLISAAADDKLVRRALAAGFNLVIHKPFPVAEIVAAVHAFAEKAGEGRSRAHHAEVA